MRWSAGDNFALPNMPADKSTDKIRIATVRVTQTMQSGKEVEPKDLHTTLIQIINEALNESAWGEDAADRQEVQMPQEMQSAAQSGSKRSREMVEQEPHDIFIVLPPAKRLS